MYVGRGGGGWLAPHPFTSNQEMFYALGNIAGSRRILTGLTFLCFFFRYDWWGFAHLFEVSDTTNSRASTTCILISICIIYYKYTLKYKPAFVQIPWIQYVTLIVQVTVIMDLSHHNDNTKENIVQPDSTWWLFQVIQIFWLGQLSRSWIYYDSIQDFEIEKVKLTVMFSCSPKTLEFGHFTLLFYRGW